MFESGLLIGYDSVVDQFAVHSGKSTKIKESVISFVSNSPKWIWTSGSGASVTIESSFLLAKDTLETETQVKTENVKVVVSIATYRHFRSNPGFRFCVQSSKDFTHSIFVLPLRSSLLMRLAFFPFAFPR